MEQKMCLNNGFPSKETVDKIKKDFPIGCRVKLLDMKDMYRKLPRGSKGTVSCVDDVGTIHVNWDCGSTLGVVYDEDECERIENEKIRIGFITNDDLINNLFVDYEESMINEVGLKNLECVHLERGSSERVDRVFVPEKDDYSIKTLELHQIIYSTYENESGHVDGMDKLIHEVVFDMYRKIAPKKQMYKLNEDCTIDEIGVTELDLILDELDDYFETKLDAIAVAKERICIRLKDLESRLKVKIAEVADLENEIMNYETKLTVLNE